MMRQKKVGFLFIVAVILVGISGFIYAGHPHPPKKFPYLQMGFTKEQAAAYLLNRFTFGPTPGKVDAVAKEGIEHWFYRQLEGNENDAALANRLQALHLDAANLSLEEMANTYPNNGEVVALARKMGVIENGNTSFSKQAYREKLKAFMQQQGYKPIAELERQLIVQKIIRAAYSNNQLQEVLTDFWFNHFNV